MLRLHNIMIIIIIIIIIIVHGNLIRRQLTMLTGANNVKN